MNVTICKPAKSKDGNSDWYCTWQIASEFGAVRKKSFGTDAWQAFNNSIVLMDVEIYSLISDNKIEWVGGNGVSLLPETKA